MEIKTKEVKLNYAYPEKGCLLTQAGDVEIQNRIFTDYAILAVNDDESNWKDITIEEADAIKAEQERIENEEMNKQNG